MGEDSGANLDTKIRDSKEQDPLRCLPHGLLTWGNFSPSSFPWPQTRSQPCRGPVPGMRRRLVFSQCPSCPADARKICDREGRCGTWGPGLTSPSQPQELGGRHLLPEMPRQCHSPPGPRSTPKRLCPGGFPVSS
ncbi:uncharacterized protein LOC144576743 isoform X2 [Callithrix jacchus]